MSHSYAENKFLFWPKYKSKYYSIRLAHKLHWNRVVLWLYWKENNKFLWMTIALYWIVTHDDDSKLNTLNPFCIYSQSKKLNKKFSWNFKHFFFTVIPNIFDVLDLDFIQKSACLLIGYNDVSATETLHL